MTRDQIESKVSTLLNVSNLSGNAQGKDNNHSANWQQQSGGGSTNIKI